MPPVLRTLGRWIARLGAALVVLACVWAATFVIIKHRYPTYTLPNGMIVKRKYADWLFRHPYYDIYAPDGVTLRAPDVWLICFNDRYLDVWGRQDIFGTRREDSGMFDGRYNGRRLSDREFTNVHRWEFHSPDVLCNGYYISMVAPDMLHPGNWTGRRLPPCLWRNRNNPKLQKPEWLNRPCSDEKVWQPERQPPAGEPWPDWQSQGDIPAPRLRDENPL